MVKNNDFLFQSLVNDHSLDDHAPYQVPETRYFHNKEVFDRAVGQDFIDYANKMTDRGQKFLVGLAHGQSPAGAYAYILDHYHEIRRSSLIRFTFTNSRLKRQRGLEGVKDAKWLLTRLLKKRLINKDQILGRNLDRDDIDAYAEGFNVNLKKYLVQNNKQGYDYVFLSFDPTGRVAGVSRNSVAFDSTELAIIVEDNESGEREITGTPYFLAKAKRIAFLATKADKRRPLAWLYDRYGKPNESPSFLRHIDRVRDRMTVFIDDRALTWPQVTLVRKTPYGNSTIRLDLAQPYKEDAVVKLPVILLVHGFLGLNSFDSILTGLSTHCYIGAAMHYGSIPHDLPVEEYSQHVVRNIDAAIQFFGEKGHPVYLFDHSMGNTYFMIMDRDYDDLPGVNQYLRGRIGANPFFCEHAKHACLGFLDTVLLPAVRQENSLASKAMLRSLRRVIPLDTKKGVRLRGKRMMRWMISKHSSIRERVWRAAKARIIGVLRTMDALPHLDRIPIERALQRLPVKLFAIQVYAALQEYETHKDLVAFEQMAKHDVPILILMSRRDAIAKFVPRLHRSSNVNIIDVTNPKEKDGFREHLYHMVNPEKATETIEHFIDQVEERWKKRSS